MNWIFTICLFLIPVILAHTQDKTLTYDYDAGTSPPEVFADFTHVEVSIVPDTLKSSIKGEAVFSFTCLRQNTDSLVFYIPTMEIFSVRMNELDCNTRRGGNNLTVYPPITLEKGGQYKLFIGYEGTPTTDCNFIGWNRPRNLQRKQIWAHRPSGWIPYTTDRITMDIRIRFDKRYSVFTNGERVAVTPGPGETREWHYRMNRDHPFFSTSLVIGDYVYKQRNADDGTPMELWYYPDQEDHFEPTYRYMEKMFPFFLDEFGAPYPYELYREAPVVDYTYGAMETTTATVFGDYLHVDPRGFRIRNYINVNAHELAHQWFGNCLAHLAPKDVWLTESFATYYARMFEKSIYGEDYNQNERNNELKRTFNAAAKDHFAVGHSSGGVDRWYPKGSLVLDMLRDVLGDQDFKSAIKRYFTTHAFGMVETPDFFTAVYAATGKPMNWFFDQWILRGGEPHYKVSYSVSDDLSGKRFTSIRVEQIQDITPTTGLFRMPVDMEVHYTDGSKSMIRHWIEDKLHMIPIENPGKKNIAFVLFDPGRKVIKKLTFDRSYEELSAQALTAEGMIDRYDALLALKAFPAGKKRDLLEQIFSNETFHLIKSAVIEQLADDSLSVGLTGRAINDPDALVRRAVVTYVTKVPLTQKAGYESLLTDSCYLNLEKALENLCISFPSDIERYLDITKQESGWRGKNIRIKWLEIAIQSGKIEFLPELTDYTTEDYEFETRQNALNALQRLDICDEPIALNLIRACVYWNFRLSGTARENLKYFYKQNSKKAVIDKVLHDVNLISEQIRTQIKAILSS